YNITNRENIENAIKELAGTHVANLQPNHELGSDEGSICACALSNLKHGIFFLLVKIQKIIKTQIIEKPTPITFTHTQPKNNWTTLLP
ncbi:8957_t:CDS:2, partial [Gigaspora rosea]